MTRINASDLLAIILVLVDDWFQTQGIRFLKGKPGAKPEFSDSEVITWLLAMDFIPFPGKSNSRECTMSLIECVSLKKKQEAVDAKE